MGPVGSATVHAATANPDSFWKMAVLLVYTEAIGPYTAPSK
jgi:F0F1-type ATP synthase membrane subunit c/vacuolar-type H+-ATPase subunit K